MNHRRLNAYHIMWIFVFFDLPTLTKPQRKSAARFRKDLEAFGFKMMQFSVYVRHCPSYQHVEAHTKRIISRVPDEGNVKIMAVTDKQYSSIVNFWRAPSGPKKSRVKRSDIRGQLQLELF